MTSYFELSRSQRYRLRKKGMAIPRKPMPSGYRQTPEHVEKRSRRGADNYQWLGDSPPPAVGRKRAWRIFRDLGPCTQCGAEKSERHHKDENPGNNHPENIAVLCHKCHMAEHARLNRMRKLANA